MALCRRDKARQGSFRAEKELYPMPNIDGLTEVIAKAITHLLEQGVMEPPLYCAAVAANGSMFCWHWLPQNGPGVAGRVVAKHIEGGGMAAPINVYVSDGHGGSELMIIEYPAE
jgi:hypothetical protein